MNRYAIWQDPFLVENRRYLLVRGNLKNAPIKNRADIEVSLPVKRRTFEEDVGIRFDL